MKPVDQTVFTVPGGNCFSACVATLLELPLEAVPYFMGDFDEPDGAWVARFAAWLKPHGFYPLFFRCPPDGDWHPAGEYILSAGSPRGEWDHSVVAVGREIVHDPHPSRAGLVRREKSDATILVPFTFSREVPMSDDIKIMQWFAYNHLPPHLQKVSKMFSDLAVELVAEYDPGEELSEALRKLLEAKDCAVRAAIATKKPTPATGAAG